MKRITLALTLMALLFSLCSCYSGNSSSEFARVSWVYSNIYNNGEFYEYGEKLRYIDFETMQSAYICSKPNCLHDDLSVCSAFGIRNHPTVVEDDLYFFETYIENADEKMQTNTDVYKSSLDATNRYKITTIKNLSIEHYNDMLVKGNIAYFIGTEVVFDDFGTTTGANPLHFCSYDYANNDFINYGEIISGFSTGYHFLGEYNEKLFFTVSYMEEEIDWSNITVEDLFTITSDNTITRLYEFDLNSKVFALSDMPYPVIVGSGYYVYQDGENCVIIDERGESKTINGLKLYDGSIINDKVFIRLENKVIDIQSGKVFSLVADGLEAGFEVIYYHNNCYIVKETDISTGAPVYHKLIESELIGAEF